MMMMMMESDEAATVAAELRSLGIVSKVCKELDNHKEAGNRTVAEFIVHIASKAENGVAFHQEMASNGAAFGADFANHLYSVIRSMSSGKPRDDVSRRQAPEKRQDDRKTESRDHVREDAKDERGDEGQERRARRRHRHRHDERDFENHDYEQRRHRERHEDSRGHRHRRRRRRHRRDGADYDEDPTAVYSGSESDGMSASQMTAKASSQDQRFQGESFQKEVGVATRAAERGGMGRIKKSFGDYERWEIAQLKRSGALSVEDFPDIGDERAGIMDFEATEEQLEVEVSRVEPAFLLDHGFENSMEKSLEPVRVIKNPDGSMQRAALHQVQLSTERREMRRAQEQDILDSIPKDLNRPWQDPLPSAGERHLAVELRNLGSSSSFALPEWKMKSRGKGVSYGFASKGSLQEQRQSLPIFRLKEQLLDAMRRHQVLVVIGETGSGKTTQMTQYLHEMGIAGSGIVGCTQPRRVAAQSVAKRVAEEYGCRLGEEVGYSIRFDDCTSKSTRIKYMTDGMLMREYLMDNNLRKYSAIMLDEAHERTIHTDVLFGLLKSLVRRRRDLRLIVTSATLDAEKFSSYFYECPIFTIPGRTFPVEVMYTKEPEADYLDAALIVCMQIHLEQPPGDILLFLTGQEEIDSACELLYNRMKQLGKSVPELIILPVYSALPSEMQTRIFDPAPEGARKCIIATNIAEASLTIDGIFYVVDPGFTKQKVHNAKTGMDSLVVVPCSQASARQRAGRAGRTGPGKCYRLYTEEAYNNEMLPSPVPEIQRTGLGNVVLSLKAMGIQDLLRFNFMDAPPEQTLVSALELLYALGALDEEGLLTRLGRRMAEFPLEPQLSKVLIMSVELGCSEEVLTIVSMLSVDNVWYRPKEKQAQADQKKARFHQPEGDHITMLALYDAWAKSNYSSQWCFENYVQARTMKRAADIRKQLVGILDRYGFDILSCGKNYNKVRMALVSGYFTHAAKRDPQEGYRTMVDGQPVFVHPNSALFNKSPEYVLYHELVLTTKEYMRNIMAIDAKWLIELAPNFFKKGDRSRISKHKRMEKIQPLHDKYAIHPEAWRLSRRKG
eukprot:g3671.t1